MRRARGFTLLEVVFAVAVTAMMGVIIAAAFQSGYKTKELVEQEADRYRDQNDRPTNFIGARDRLLFTTMAHQRLYADAKESDQMVAEYYTKSAPGPGGQQRLNLMRREDSILDDRIDRGGTEDVLIENVKRIDFAYWDSDKKDWVDEWDTRRIEKKSILPVRVRFSIYALDENGREARYVTQTRIVLNTEIPRF